MHEPGHHDRHEEFGLFLVFENKTTKQNPEDRHKAVYPLTMTYSENVGRGLDNSILLRKGEPLFEGRVLFYMCISLRYLTPLFSLRFDGQDVRI